MGEIIDKWDKIIAILGVIATIVAAFLGAYLGTSGSRDLVKEQNNALKKNIATAFYIDISSLMDDWSAIAPQFEKDLNNNTCSISYSIRGEYYSNNGIYYSYQNEITSLNPNLSRDLFAFYTNVSKAEQLNKVTIGEMSKIDLPKFTAVSIWSSSTNSGYNFNESERQSIYEIYPWGSDEQLKYCILQTYNPMISNDQNDARIRSVMTSLQMKRSLVNAYHQAPSLLDELNDTINESSS
jgi:hypothetical protein